MVGCRAAVLPRWDVRPCGRAVWEEKTIVAIKCDPVAPKIYAIRFYGRKLTDEEIQKNYVVDKARFVF